MEIVATNKTVEIASTHTANEINLSLEVKESAPLQISLQPVKEEESEVTDLVLLLQTTML